MVLLGRVGRTLNVANHHALRFKDGQKPARAGLSVLNLQVDCLSALLPASASRFSTALQSCPTFIGGGAICTVLRITRRKLHT